MWEILTRWSIFPTWVHSQSEHGIFLSCPIVDSAIYVLFITNYLGQYSYYMYIQYLRAETLLMDTFILQGSPHTHVHDHDHVSIGALSCGGNANSYFDEQKFGFISKTVHVYVFQLSVGLYNMLPSSCSRIIQKLYLF